MILAEKQRLREEVRRDLRRFPAPVRGSASRKIVAALREAPLLRDAGAIALFAPLRSEPDLLPLLADGTGGRFVFPGIRGEGLEWRLVAAAADLEPGPLGIRVPSETAPPFPPEAIDLVLVPGMAFGPAGERLGRGGGFYDRFFDAVPRARRIGVCFELQFRGAVPCEPHDALMDSLVTEAQTRYFPQNGSRL